MLNRFYRSLLLLLVVAGISSCSAPAHVPDQNFNEGWRFHKGEIDAAAPDFDDSAWRQLDLPHDWAIEGPFSNVHNARTGGLPVTGQGWYRKTFTVPAEMQGKKVSVEFDGAMNEAHVWVNGAFVGERPFGYIGFEFDITNQVKFGQQNVIAVRLHPKDLSSRWYPGAGLYRNVRIKYNHPTHIAQWGTYITTPVIANNSTTVKIATTINQGSNKALTLKTSILDDKGTEVTSTEQALSQPTKEQLVTTTSLQLSNPRRWKLDDPYLYTVHSEIWDGKTLLDRYTSSFGVRTLEITANDGLLLNGERVQLNGVCMHHDLGPLGAAVNYRALERQVEIMVSMGVNTIRTSHNPPASELLDICDKMGILVIVEAFDEWKIGKVKNGYNRFFDEWAEQDLRDMIKRDRNHPSVIMWSIGNEILEQGRKDGWKVAKMLNDICHDEDPSRMTTVGFNYYPAPFVNKLAYQVDVVGMNYKPANYAEIKANNPDMILYGSETSSQTSSRGVYQLPLSPMHDKESLQVSGYDVNIGPPWAYPPDVEFERQESLPYLLGEYMWTGFDYLGEPTPYGGRDNSTNGYWNDDWPIHSSYFAPVDLVGLPKDRYYLYQSQWTTTPMVHLLPHWNWEGKEGEPIPIMVYTNAEEVELFLNGQSLGKKVKGKDLTRVSVKYNGYDKDYIMSPYRLSWEVSYAPGKLTAVAYKNGQVVAEKSRITAGKPARLELTPDRRTITANGQDMSFITISVVDKDGNLCPRADHMINFEVTGEGFLAGVGNGNPASLTPLKGDKMEAFSGQLVAYIQAAKEKGQIAITATTDGLPAASVTITSE